MPITFIDFFYFFLNSDTYSTIRYWPTFKTMTMYQGFKTWSSRLGPHFESTQCCNPYFKSESVSPIGLDRARVKLTEFESESAEFHYNRASPQRYKAWGWRRQVFKPCRRSSMGIIWMLQILLLHNPMYNWAEMWLPNPSSLDPSTNENARKGDTLKGRKGNYS